MAEAPPSADASSTGAVRGPRLPRGVAGAAALIAAGWAVGVCLAETPAAAWSVCGTCRESARASLEGEGAWAVGASALAALVARFAGPGEFRVARSVALVALVFWLVSLGFVRGWW
jgi:hypothetical protein